MEKSESITEDVLKAKVIEEETSHNFGNVKRRSHSQITKPLKNYLRKKNGKIFAGEHLLLDFWDADFLSDPDYITQVLIEAAEASAATVLHVHTHAFNGEGGISGVAVLAESHISVHTWPELNFAAFDIFMCGKCEPREAVKILEQRFRPNKTSIESIKRGLVK